MKHVSTILYYMTRNNKDIFLSEKKIESTVRTLPRIEKKIDFYLRKSPG